MYTEQREEVVTLPQQQNFWMTTNRIVAQKVILPCFKRSYSVSFNLSDVGEIYRVESESTVGLEKENFCIVFTYSIKRAREIGKFNVAVVQRRLRNVQKSVMHVQNCCCANIILLFLLFSLPSPSSLIKLPIVVIQKFCCHGNVTSHLSSLQKRQENACQRFFNKLSYEHMSVHRLHIHRYTHIFSSYQRHIHTGHARCTGLRHTYRPLENKREKKTIKEESQN